MGWVTFTFNNACALIVVGTYVECSELTLNIKVYVVLPSCDDTPTTLVSLNYGSYFYVDFYNG